MTTQPGPEGVDVLRRLLVDRDGFSWFMSVSASLVAHRVVAPAPAAWMRSAAF